MERFKKGKTQLLVATDVAARGIDVNELSHVINYNLPDSTEAYVHRSGRTGRAHNTGVSLVIVNMREKHRVRALENKIGKSFEQSKIPTGADICEKQLFNLMDNICKVEVDDAQIEKYIEVINKKFENLSKEEIIKKVVSTEFGRFIDHYKNAPDLNSNVGKNNSDIKMIMQVHDELIFEVKKGFADEALKNIISLMEGSVKLDIPLIVDANTGTNWNEAH